MGSSSQRWRPLSPTWLWYLLDIINADVELMTVDTFSAGMLEMFACAKPPPTTRELDPAFNPTTTLPSSYWPVDVPDMDLIPPLRELLLVVFKRPYDWLHFRYYYTHSLQTEKYYSLDLVRFEIRSSNVITGVVPCFRRPNIR